VIYIEKGNLPPFQFYSVIQDFDDVASRTIISYWNSRGIRGKQSSRSCEHPTLIADNKRRIFGGLIPMKWESCTTKSFFDNTNGWKLCAVQFHEEQLSTEA
jgi:hypothetical protein